MGKDEHEQKFGITQFSWFTDSAGRVWVHVTTDEDPENQLDIPLDDIMEFARDHE